MTDNQEISAPPATMPDRPTTPGRSVRRAELEEYLRFETLLADLMARLIKLAPEEVGGEIQTALRCLCEGLGLDRATLWELSMGPEASDSTASRSFQLVYAYQVDGLPPIPRTADASLLVPWINERLGRGESLILERLDQLPPEAAVDREGLQRYGTKSTMVLPLLSGKNLIGCLAFASVRRERSWPPHTVQRFQLCAQVFAEAIDRQRADIVRRELTRRLMRAHEAERARLARELHDDVTQRLALLAIDLARVEAVIEQPGPAGTVRSVSDGLARLSEDVHALSYRLHPTLLEDLGLVAALQGECDRLRQQGSLNVELTLGEIPNGIPSDAALCLFRVLQESLNNVARHARARTVEVSLRMAGGGLQLGVRDDGVGFAAGNRRRAGHIGLAGMAERLELVAGEFDIDSVPGAGTTVVAWVPFPRQGS